MIYSEFSKCIIKDNIQSSYLFIDKEEYMMNIILDKLKDKYIDKSFETINFIKIEGKDATLDTLINACETLPFMSSKKIVLFRDIHIFLEGLDKTMEKELYKYLDDLGDYLVLVFMDNASSIKKNSKFYKYFNKKDQVVEFPKLSGNDLNQWILSILKKYDRHMSISNINYFVEHSSYRSKNIDLSLYDLENELVKAINYTTNKEITKEDIDLVLAKSIDTNIFELLNAINSSNGEKALSIFNDMYISNEPIPRIFYMITRQIRLMLGYKLYKKMGYSESKIQEKIGIKSYEFSKVRGQSGKFTAKQLEDIMKELLEIDIRMKTASQNDKLEMEMLVVRLCSYK